MSFNYQIPLLSTNSIDPKQTPRKQIPRSTASDLDYLPKFHFGTLGMFELTNSILKLGSSVG